MADILTGTIPGIQSVRLPDVIGIWEVIRISREGEHPVYPWIKERFLFDFMDEMMFSCIMGGRHFNGTWELVTKTWDEETLCSIRLNDTFEYIIININEDEMIMTDRGSKYSLTRKL